MPEVNSSTASRQLYVRLLRQTLPYWKGFSAAVVAMVIYAATSTGFAALMKPMLDGSFVDRDQNIIRMVPLMIIGLFLVRGLAGFVSTYRMTWTGRRVVTDLRSLMFNKLLQLPVAFYDRSSTGQLVSKLVYDVEQVSAAATNAITILVRDTLTIIGLLAWMAYLNWMLTLIFVIAGPPIALLVAHVNRRFRRISTNIQNSMGEVTHVVEEAIEGQRIIKTFGGQEYEHRQFGRVNEANNRLNMKMVATSSSSMGIIELIAASALSGIIFLATLPNVLDTITVGGFMSFIVAMMMLLTPLKRLTTVHAMIQRGIAAAHSIYALLDSEVEKDHGTRVLGRAKGAVEYRDVHFSYDMEKGQALAGVSFRAEPGECIAFVGRSGSGKSTLVSLLPRFYDVDAGTILLDDGDISSLSLVELRKQIAWVGQDVVLFNDTIANNIAYGVLEKVDEDRIIRAAEAAHAMEFITRLPQGLQTMVGERGVLLSGGQRQRLAIARALLKDAPVLILDEATSALDTESEKHIQAALAELMRHRTTLVIAHRLSTIEHADRIIVLEGGRIVEQGRHAELLELGRQYASLYRLQFHNSALVQNKEANISDRIKTISV